MGHCDHTVTLVSIARADFFSQPLDIGHEESSPCQHLTLTTQIADLTDRSPPSPKDV